MGAWKVLGELALLGARLASKYISAGVRDAVRVLTLQKIMSMSQQAGAKRGASSVATTSSRIMPLEEAYKILNVDKGAPRQTILDNYWRMFRANEETSLYVQSKFVRARQRIEEALRGSLDDGAAANKPPSQ